MLDLNQNITYCVNPSASSAVDRRSLTLSRAVVLCSNWTDKAELWARFWIALNIISSAFSSNISSDVSSSVFDSSEQVVSDIILSQHLKINWWTN